MNKYEDQLQIEIKTKFLEIIVNKAQRVMPELLEKQGHLMSIQINILEKSFETKEFKEFARIQEEDLNKFYNLALDLKKDLENMKISKRDKSAIMELLSVDNNSSIKEKMELYKNMHQINDLLLLSVDIMPNFILEQFSNSERNKLEKFPDNVVDFNEKCSLVPNDEDIILKNGSFDYVNLLSKEMKRLNGEMKNSFFNWFQESNKINKTMYSNFVTENVWKQKDEYITKFIQPENTYCLKTIDFIEKSRMVFISNKKIADHIIQTRGEVINNIAQKLNAETHMLLIIYMESIPTLYELDIKKEPLLEKCIKTNKNISFKELEKKLKNRGDLEKAYKQIIFELEEYKINKKIGFFLENFDNMDLSISHQSGRAINFNIEHWKEYVRFPEKIMDIQFVLNGVQLIKSFDGTRMLALKDNPVNLTDNQILKEFYILVNNFFEDETIIKQLNKYDIIDEKIASKDFVYLVDNFNRSLRGLNLKSGFQEKEETSPRKKV